MSLAHLTSDQRQRIFDAVYEIRDLCYSAAGSCLHAARSVRIGADDDEILTAELLGKLEQVRLLAMGLTREIGR